MLWEGFTEAGTRSSIITETRTLTITPTGDLESLMSQTLDCGRKLQRRVEYPDTGLLPEQNRTDHFHTERSQLRVGLDSPMDSPNHCTTLLSHVG